MLMKHNMKRILAGWLCILLLLPPIQAAAADTEQVFFSEGGSVTPSQTSAGTDLLTAYAQQQLDALRGKSLSGGKLKAARRTSLDGMNAAIYNALKPRIAQVAAGEQDSTVYSFTWAELGLEKVTWSAQELGVTSCKTEEARKKAFARISFDFNLVIDALLADCPYDLYWYDKTSSTSYSGVSWSCSDDSFRITSPGYTFYFPVSQDYAVGQYTVDTSYGAAVSAAVENIRSIVSQYAAAADYDKLCRYRDRICALTDYNHAAAGGSAAYGNPWQLIWVFDGDPGTTVVCEGYSKAFQYLCELSTFRSPLVSVYSVSGKMDGGAHMWNIVTMDNGKNYLADITNYDSGFGDYLFLVGYAGGSVTDGYQIATSWQTIRYVYDSDMFLVFSSAELTLSGNTYLNDIAGSPTPTATPTATPTPTPTATPSPAPQTELFADVADPSAYFYESVYWAKENGITTGTSPTTFSPYAACTRGQIVTFLWRVMGQPSPASWGNPFKDVRESDYYYTAVLWAYHSGVTTGTSPTTFAPNKACTREQCVTFLWRAAGRPDTSLGTQFRDVKGDAYYAAPVYWALNNGITTGVAPASFGVGQKCTRGQIVTFLYRAQAFMP